MSRDCCRLLYLFEKISTKQNLSLTLITLIFLQLNLDFTDLVNNYQNVFEDEIMVISGIHIYFLDFSVRPMETAIKARKAT